MTKQHVAGGTGRRRWRARGNEPTGKSRLAAIALWLVLGAIAAALLSGLGTGQGWWSYGAGLGALRWIFFVAVAGALLGLIARLFGKGGKGVSIIAFLLGAAFAAYLGNFARVARSVPAIHDATTDLADPPAFTHLPLRADNLAKIPKTDRPGWAALPPLERWRAIHADAYSDLRPVILPVPPAQALAKAEALARARGWRIAAVDKTNGRLEATAVSRFFRFKDDVVVRVRPHPSGSVVDLRSVSRVGVSDLGENAKRIRAFVADLRG
jgi:uncharacterized protein (DUF1499 family)